MSNEKKEKQENVGNNERNGNESVLARPTRRNLVVGRFSRQRQAATHTARREQEPVHENAFTVIVWIVGQ